MSQKRFDCFFFEKHFGFGIRWDSWQFPLHVSISILFVTFTIGFGSHSGKKFTREEIEMLNWQVELSNWLIENQCYVLRNSIVGGNQFVCFDVDMEQIGIGQDYYGAIFNAKNNSMAGLVNE